MEQRGPSGRTWRLALEGATDGVTRSRDFTRLALTAWHWLPAQAEEDRDAADDVLLMVSEVVANACLHGGGPSALVLDCTPERLRVEVMDGNPAPPVPPNGRSAEPGRPGGHGLLIVDRLARSWGSQPGADGKCVWLEVACPTLVRQRLLQAG
ncbi:MULTISPECIES: ATP-binding protein [unclassified Streptomyces]|uniref:ATP-binding protein n=1 Tax=unclassified Streptomyces TaxID=2593676 RepID=UPI001BE7C0E8|nr:MULTISPECIES: ATP-binding protein [unclassified Streptomyces]MBT2403186.1 ATP-binding protein [Streptomyces sp. ISL-21]MBT2459224.1 ATP-binding protein [Streptomyces sp. ISL-86]MBT2610137.1 ATP-binding protein [Streptomyces sp. ISL-87]